MITMIKGYAKIIFIIYYLILSIALGSERDQKMLEFADDFESRFVTQGWEENRKIEETLEIDEDSEQRWNIEYGSLVPTLIKAVQELSAKVEALESN